MSIKTIISLFLLAVLIFIGSWTFLFTNHYDNLIKFAPGESNLYIHTKTTAFSSAKTEHKQFFYNWLSSNSPLSYDQWQLIEQVNREVSLFTLNNQAFGLILNSKINKELLANNNISFTETDKVLYFPEIIIAETNLLSQQWLKSIYNKVHFKPMALYIKDYTQINPLLAPFKQSNDNSLAILAKFKDEQSNFYLSGQVGQKNSKKIEPQLLDQPSNAQIYVQNIQTNQISQEVEYSLDNLPFLLLKKTSGPVEFIKTASGFELIANSTDNPFDYIQTNILQILSFIFPSEIEKELPDQTVAIHHIADPTVWEFETDKNENSNSSSLFIEHADINFLIEKQDKSTKITYNSSYTKQSTGTVDNNLPKFGKDALIYVNLQHFLPNSNLQSATVYNNKLSSISLCIH